MVDKENYNSENQCVFERKTAAYSDKTSRFIKEGDNYIKQYASLYVKRLEELIVILKEKVKAKWGSDVTLIPLSELEDQDGKRCIIIGTLYKHQPNKPSILQELSDENQLLMPEPKPDYCSEEDQLFLEDQTSRIKLSGDKVNVKESVTGVVCAIIGSENQKSSFEVEDWCFAGCPSQLSIPATATSSRKLIFLSGLELASNPHNLSLTLLTEWLGGFAGNEEVQEEEASVVRVIIAGNSIKGSIDQHLSRGHASGKAEDAAAAKELTKGLQKLDSLLETIGYNCCITIMPGQFDVSTLMMPQQPMHSGLFSKAKGMETISGVMNPWIGKVADKIVVGTSGQPIQNIHKVCGFNTLKSIEWLERTLEWRHLCPTAPDTVPCMPFYKNDPFILKECPDIYFAGNMDKFDTKMYTGSEGQKVRLLCIPKFSSTQTAVLVDLDSLDTVPILFGPK